jgi:DNA-binding NtrC family response regulator
MADQYIICVDDERTILDGLHAQLHREFGHKFIIELAESGEEALEIINELEKEDLEIPIIISDQLMPGMQGHEFLINAHSIVPQTLKVLLTGQTNIQAITEAVNKAKLYRYLEKPWDSTDLLLTVKEAIRSYHKDRELEQKNIHLMFQPALLDAF